MRANRLHTEEDGAALVELALMMPVFVLVVFGILQVALALFAFCNLTYASHAGARYASLHGASSSTPATNASIRTMMKPFLWLTGGKAAPVTTTWSPSNSLAEEELVWAKTSSTAMVQEVRLVHVTTWV